MPRNNQTTKDNHGPRFDTARTQATRPGLGSYRAVKFRRCSALGAFVVLLSLVWGCIPIGPAIVRVQGTVLDSATQEPVPFATVSIRLISLGRGEDLGSTESTVSDGRFVEDISVPAESGRTDEIEIIVVQGRCSERYLLSSEDDIVVDVTFRAIVFEVKEPILVPSCEQSP